MSHVGANVYLWDRPAQDRFLVQSLSPTLRELRREGLVERFWFERFDARGPHLFLLFTVPPDQFAAVRGQVAELLAGAVKSSPCTLQLAHEELAERHRMTRGWLLSEPDALPGIADHNSFLLFEHRSDGYPFQLAAGLSAPEDFYRVLDDLAGWTLRQLESSPNGIPLAAGIRWMAALDRELRERGAASDYWRYHAATLLLKLEEALASSGERRVLESSRKAVGEENRRVFSRIWEEVEASEPPWPQIPRLAETALSGPRAGRPFYVLRQVAHSSLKQLGIPVQHQIPLVLYAWTRTMAS